MPKTPSKGSASSAAKVEINLDLSPEQAYELLRKLKVRFEKNMQRHEGLEWSKVKERLEAQPGKLASLHAMESTGGEPDVVGYDREAGEVVFL